jgi:hypothetical protein
LPGAIRTGAVEAKYVDVKKVVGYPVSKLGDDVGCRGGDNEEIHRLRKRNVGYWIRIIWCIIIERSRATLTALET